MRYAVHNALALIDHNPADDFAGAVTIPKNTYSIRTTFGSFNNGYS